MKLCEWGKITWKTCQNHFFKLKTLMYTQTVYWIKICMDKQVKSFIFLKNMQPWVLNLNKANTLLHSTEHWYLDSLKDHSCNLCTSETPVTRNNESYFSQWAIIYAQHINHDNYLRGTSRRESGFSRAPMWILDTGWEILKKDNYLRGNLVPRGDLLLSRVEMYSCN